MREAVHRLGLQVAIDGPAGAGKSTVGRGLSHSLGCLYLDTGLMYRAVTWKALQKGVALSDAQVLAGLAQGMTFALGHGKSAGLLIDGCPPEAALRGPAVDAAVSDVSAHAAVRREMVRRQRELADDRCIVMVGRDIGTTVLPEAPVKLWVTASAEERARRRQEERPADPPGLETLAQIQARDAIDSGRAVSPLKRAPDAVILETDRLEPEETLRRALDAVEDAVRRLRGEQATRQEPARLPDEPSAGPAR